MRFRGGFTLLEIMVATALFTVVLLGLLSALTGAERVRVLSRERTAAGLRASSVADDVAATPWDTLPGRTGETFGVTVETGAGSWSLRPPAGQSAPGTVVVQDAPSPDLRQIRVTVRWLSRAGGEGRVEMVTLVARH